MISLTDVSFVLQSIVKNLIMGSLKPLFRGRGRLGMDGDINWVARDLNRLVSLIPAGTVDIRARRVLEIGPGRTPHLMVAFQFAGARQVIGYDVRNWLATNWKEQGVFDEWGANLTGNAGVLVRDRLGVRVEEMIQYSKLTYNPGVLEHKLYDGCKLLEPDASIALIYSKSVLEHLRSSAVKSILQEHYRVLEPGGFALHVIDLRDHTRICGDDRVTGNWLQALRYPEWLHNAMTWNRNAYINRLRARDWRALFEDTGFRIVEWKTFHTALPTGLAQMRLAKQYRLCEQELSVSWVDVLLAKPS